VPLWIWRPEISINLFDHTVAYSGVSLTMRAGAHIPQISRLQEFSKTDVSVIGRAIGRNCRSRLNGRGKKNDGP